jgi:hypothetical protein
MQQVRLRKRKVGEGVSYGICLVGNRKKIGHISGFERDEHQRGPAGELQPAQWLDVTRTMLDEEERGRGTYQKALQQVANLYKDGVKSAKYQTSRALQRAMRKMPTFAEDEHNFLIRTLT